MSISTPFHEPEEEEEEEEWERRGSERLTVMNEKEMKRKKEKGKGEAERERDGDGEFMMTLTGYLQIISRHIANLSNEAKKFVILPCFPPSLFTPLSLSLNNLQC